METLCVCRNHSGNDIFVEFAQPHLWQFGGSEVTPRESRFKILKRRLCRATVMKLLHDARRQPLFGVHWMSSRYRFAKENLVVPNHQLIRDAHKLAKHLGRRLVDTDVVAKTFAHFL